MMMMMIMRRLFTCLCESAHSFVGSGLLSGKNLSVIVIIIIVVVTMIMTMTMIMIINSMTMIKIMTEPPDEEEGT